MVTVTAEAIMDAPCPRAGITIEGLGVGDSLVSLWRTADGERNPVRGARRARMVDAAFIIDYDAPLRRPVTYEVEVISGPTGPSRTISDPVTIDSATAWLMDPLVPQSAVPVVGDRDSEGTPYLRAGALAEFEYAANVSLVEIMGSDEPMAQYGQVMKARGIPLSMSARSEEQNTRLRKLLKSSAQLVFRPLPEFGWVLPGTMHISVASKTELPMTADFNLTRWEMTANTVMAPALKVLTANVTWGDVAMLFSTYQQKQDAATGTYLDDLKNPFG